MCRRVGVLLTYLAVTDSLGSRGELVSLTKSSARREVLEWRTRRLTEV